MTPQELTDEERERFRFHPATPETATRHEAVRSQMELTAAALAATVPPGRHRALMLTALQEATMWANAAIACDTTRSDG